MAEYTDITDVEQYNLRMSKSAMDKAFFIDKIEAGLIVDYGCADGALFQLIGNFMPDGVQLIGYDIDPKMIHIAREKSKHNQNITFCSDWQNICKQCIEPHKLKKGAKTAIVLNSVVHEIYDYLTVNQIDAFWETVFQFDYVVLRDMIPSEKIDRPADINDVRKVLRRFYQTKELNDFQSRWGSIENNKNLVHFLLKYKYVIPNWEREVKENYFPLYREKLLYMFPDCFDVIYHEHFCLPYIKEQIREDMHIELKDNTHLKIIFKKR
jgi:SAM-dependent methyltransferase